MASMKNFLVGRTIKAARRLEQQHQWSAAIDLLTTANKARRHQTLEHELVQMRHRSFYGSNQTGVDTWPPQFTDPFPPGPGIPEIKASELSVELVRAGVLGHGALIVRGLLAPDDVARLHGVIDACYDGQDQWYATEQPSPNDWYHEFRSTVSEQTAEASLFGRSWHRKGSAVLAADTPQGLFTYLDIVRKRGIAALAEQYLGERPAISVEKTVFRRVPPDTLGGWHQDGAFLGEGIHSLNLWIAVTDCGAEAPTMEFVATRLNHIVETGTGDAPYQWAVGDDVARSVAGPNSTVRPHFQAGDAIFFDQMNLHTTSGGPTMTKTRYAVESWWFAPSHYPPTTLPVMV